MKRGLSSGECPEMASEEVILDVHREYLEAGAHFITTNTFGGTSIKLKNYGLEEKAFEINHRNAALAREAAKGRECFVMGDIGPTGEFVEPYGIMTFDQFYGTFSEQVKGLAEGGADLIIIETMMDLQETKAAIKAAKDNSNLAIFACMTFNNSPKGFRSLTGVDPATAVSEMLEAGADVVGSNCSLVPVEIADLIKKMRAATDRPLIAQPNAGQPVIIDGKTTYDMGDNVEEEVASIIASGANIVGGCCGTDPDFIRMLRGLIDNHNGE
jgi:5-methyltetrahydrofolate--homocysteine methyltransferase